VLRIRETRPSSRPPPPLRGGGRRARTTGDLFKHCSIGEYHTLLGTKDKHKREERTRQREPALAAFYASVPSFRTSDPAQAERHLRQVAAHHRKALAVSNSLSARRRAFDTHARKQRLADELCARILSCAGDSAGDAGLGRTPTPKARFREDVVVAFGDGGFSHASKGHAAGPNKWLKRQLARRCLVIETSEFRTSKLCSRCHLPLSTEAPPGFWSEERRGRKGCGRRNATTGSTEDTSDLDWGLRRCDNSECDSLWWNRDVNAARNIGLLFFGKQLDLEVPAGFRRAGEGGDANRLKARAGGRSCCGKKRKLACTALSSFFSSGTRDTSPLEPN
jgi:hypothetical protein